jgi:putative flippase GtrA
LLVVDQQSQHPIMLPSSSLPVLRPPAPGQSAVVGRPPEGLRGLCRLRAVRFGIVAASCTAIGLIVLGVLARAGVGRLAADGIGYALAAQANFALSATFTWGDRKPRIADQAGLGRAAWVRAWSARWAKFNAVALAALGVDELLFGEALRAHVALLPAGLAGVTAAAALTFTANHVVTFPALKGSEEAERRPPAELIRARAQRDGVAFFLPAYNEAANLRVIVPRTVAYFDDLACPFSVIIVDDGSTRDETYEVAERLAKAHPGHVQTLHHAGNEGYGAALCSGFAAALRTGHGLVGFCDADGQFDIGSFGTLLAVLQDQDADAAIGYRIARADSVGRRLLGRGWKLLSRLALGLRGVRDVDCGFKLFSRRVLEDVLPSVGSQHATVSPELLYRTRAAGYRIAEAGISHSARAHGRQTGASPGVVLASVLQLVRLRSQLSVQDRSALQPAAPPALPPASGQPARSGAVRQLAWLVAAVAAGLSVAAYAVTVRLHAVMLYTDAISHEEIARRVVDGTSPGLAQLGGVWLPLQHLLMLPFVWDNRFYQDGFAGSIVSMVSYVVTAVLVYKIVARLTGEPVAGLVAAAVFALNPNMLYVQSTPMTEPLLYCTTVAAIYCVQEWANTDRYQYLMGGALCCFLGTLTRYETWPITLCLVVAVAVIGWARPSGGRELDIRLRRSGVRDRVTVFSVVALAGIVAWVLWNWILTGNPLNFQDGPYAKPSLWLTAGDIGLHHWSVAVRTWLYAMQDDETRPLLALAAVGLLVFLAAEWRSARRFGRSLPVLSLLIMVPFFIASIYTGQRPLFVIQLYGRFTNVRFALIMLLPAAIFIGYLVGTLRRTRRMMLVAAGLVLVMVVSIGYGLVHYRNVATYNEPAAGHETVPSQAVVTFLKRHYDGGRVLMQSVNNEIVAFQVPSNQLVYEGSYGQWQPALRDPAANRIRWIVEWCGPQPDQVCRTEGRAQLHRYRLVFSQPANYRVYELRKD